MSDLPTAAEGGEDLDLGETEEAPEDEGAELDEAPEGAEAEREEPVEGDEPAPAASRPRTESQTQRLRRQLAEREQQLAEARGYQRAIEQRPMAPAVDPQVQQRQILAQYQERWSQMNPADAMVEMWQLGQQQMQNMIVNQHIATNDRIDKQAYDIAARSSPVHQRYAAEVEREFATARGRGNYDETREKILQRLVGAAAIERGSRAAPAQRRLAARRVAGQQARPTGARSDGAAQNRRPAEGTPEHDDALINEYFQSGGRL